MKLKIILASSIATFLLAMMVVAREDSTAVPHDIFSSWELEELYPGGRFDALAYLGNDIVIMGSRGKNRGHIVRSMDLGKHWEKIENVTEDEITCLANGKNGVVYMLTGEANFYRSTDYGKTWEWKTKISQNSNYGTYTLSYGLMVTDHGTILVSDTESSGGHIYRSEDQGETWKDLGTISDKALYRFERTGNGILVNGWAGSIYKSQNDGLSWEEMQHLIDTPLYATEYLGAHVALQASESGQVFRSDNLGETWQQVEISTEAADDFVKLGTGSALLTTYREGKNMYLSLDYGHSWENIGQVNPKVNEDWLDHVIYIDKPDKVVLIGGTNQGYALRAEVNRNLLYQSVNKQNDSNHAPKKDTVSISQVMKGHFFDFENLNEPEDVLIHKNYAYVPCRDGNNVAVINLSDPENPKLVASIQHPKLLDAFSVSAEEDYLYIVSMSNQQLVIADISKPESVNVISSTTIGGKGDYNKNYDSYHTRLRKVKVKDGYAYVTHSNEGRLYILDVHNPYEPEILSYLETTDGGFAVFIDGDYAYLGGCGPGTSVIVADISDKRNPKLLKKIEDKENLTCTCDFKKKGDYLFATGWKNSTFLTFDVSNPAEMELVSIFKHPDMIGPGRLTMVGSDVYVINTINDSMCKIDVSSPKDPKLEYFITDPLIDKIYGISNDKKYLYLASRDGKSFVVLATDL